MPSFAKLVFFQKCCYTFLALLCWLPNAKSTQLQEDVDETNYNYEHVDQWSNDFPKCGGKRQSPISIYTENVASPETSSLIRKGLRSVPSVIFLNNTGHTVELEFHFNGDDLPSYSGGPLDGEYVFSTINFRWGLTNNVGSEHTMDGKRAPMEIQYVFYKKEFGSLLGAWNQPESIMAIARLAQLTDDPGQMGKVFQVIQPLLSQIREPGSSIKVDPIPFKFLEIPDRAPGRFAFYKGSLSFPPCLESVSWIVNKPYPLITSAFLDEFRKIKLSYGDNKNYRPLQTLNGREVEVFASA